MDLDRVLVKLWESLAIHIPFVYPPPEIEEVIQGMEEGMQDLFVYMLPELTKRGIVDLVEEIW